MTKKWNKYIIVTAILFYTISSYAQFLQQPYTNNWYVGNTASGEWIKFKKVWLSAGNYRFTTQAVAASGGQTVHLEINDEVLKSEVSVPKNANNEFEKVHLGYKNLSEGYYDIKLVFETGNVNCDMIFIRKSSNTEDIVLDDDTKYELNFNDGMHTFAIGGHANSTRELLNGTDPGADAVWEDPEGNKFSRNQVLSWNKQSMYNFNFPYTQETTDIYIQEQVEAKVEVIFAHGRGEPDNPSTVQVTDRNYQTGPGGAPCAGLKLMVDAIQRNPYARDQIKVAYFADNAPFHLAVKKYLGVDLIWGKKEHQEFIWNYAIKKFYQTVPREMLYFTPDGKVPMQWWTANSHLTYPTCGYEIKEFFEFMVKKMKDEFNLDAALILSTTFFDRDPRTKEIAWGVQGWFSWRNMDVRTEILEQNGKKFAFAFNGGRMPMKDCILNDWNPQTNKGTWRKEDAHIIANYDNGIPKIRKVYEDGHAQGAQWLVLEAWGDWREGSTWYRSHHPEYEFPNQYIALTREFADRNSGSILLEAEGCDEYHTIKPGNLGGAYRLNWYNEPEKEFWDANLEADLSVFRPLHNLSEITKQSTIVDKAFKKIATGLKDVWAIGSDNAIFCNEVDGYPLVAWSRADKLQLVKDIAMGGNAVWVINTAGSLMKANLPNNQACNRSTDWANKTTGIKIVDIDATQAMLWGIDDKNNVYFRDFEGLRDWTQVHGKLTSVTADESFIWGFNPEGEIMMMSTQNRKSWKRVDNPHNITKLSAGNYEVWGINNENKLYRMSSSGYGQWEYVNEGFSDVSVGIDYVWLLDTKGIPYKYEMSGFQNKTVFNPDNMTGIGENLVYGSSLIVKENPFENNLNIEISSNISEKVQIAIYDINGRLFINDRIQLEPGINQLNITQAGHLDPGMYILSVSGKNNNYKTKVIKN